MESAQYPGGDQDKQCLSGEDAVMPFWIQAQRQRPEAEWCIFTTGDNGQGIYKTMAMQLQGTFLDWYGQGEPLAQWRKNVTLQFIDTVIQHIYVPEV